MLTGTLGLCFGLNAWAAAPVATVVAPATHRSKASPARHPPSSHRAPAPERAIDGLAFNFDEHLLIDGAHDRDYAGGGNITLSGALAAHDGLDSLLGWLDRSLPLREQSARMILRPSHALSAGVLVFTPGNLLQSAPIRGDRPYASLLFLSTARRYVLLGNTIAYQTNLAVGVLGLAAVGHFQDWLHRLTGSVHPRGWENQISAGGEPTLDYRFERESLLALHAHPGHLDYDLKLTTGASLGTITEGSVGLSLRAGRIASPWWGFSAATDLYTDVPHPSPPPLPRGAQSEVFLLLGVRLKARLYDAFLEGQFRHSALRDHWRELNPLLGQAWAGLEYRSSSGFLIRYLVRWQSPELRSGVGARELLWGSVERATPFGGR